MDTLWLLPQLLWRCPICLDETSLTVKPSLFFSVLVTCGACGSTWIAEMARGRIRLKPEDGKPLMLEEWVELICSQDLELHLIRGKHPPEKGQETIYCAVKGAALYRGGAQFHPAGEQRRPAIDEAGGLLGSKPGTALTGAGCDTAVLSRESLRMKPTGQLLDIGELTLSNLRLAFRGRRCSLSVPIIQVTSCTAEAGRLVVSYHGHQASIGLVNDSAHRWKAYLNAVVNTFGRGRPVGQP